MDAGNNNNVNNNTDVREKWAPQEDEALKALVMQNGKRWTVVAEQLQQVAPGAVMRTGKQCRARYMHHLDPEISSAPWTREEEAIVIQAQRTMGNRWAQIAKLLPGRTDNAVKNVWYSKVRKVAESGGNGTMPFAAAGIADTTTTTIASNQKSSRQRKNTSTVNHDVGTKRPRRRTSNGGTGMVNDDANVNTSALTTLNVLLHFVSLPEVMALEIPVVPKAPLSSLSDFGAFFPHAAPLSGEITKNMPFDFLHKFDFSPHAEGDIFLFNQPPPVSGTISSNTNGQPQAPPPSQQQPPPSFVTL